MCSSEAGGKSGGKSGAGSGRGVGSRAAAGSKAPGRAKIKGKTAAGSGRSTRVTSRATSRATSAAAASYADRPFTTDLSDERATSARRRGEGDLPGDLEPAAVRRRLLQVLLGPLVPPGHAEALWMLLEEVGLGDTGPALLRVAGDTTRPRRNRLMAMRAVATFAPELLDGMDQNAAPTALAELADLGLHGSFDHADRASASGQVLATLLGAPVQLRDLLMDSLGKVRAAYAAPAAFAFDRVLGNDQLAALHPPILEQVVSEGGGLAVALLEREAARRPPGAARRRFEEALRRLGAARRARPGVAPASAPTGRAFVSCCDGTGSFLVLAAVDSPSGSVTRVDLVLRLGQGVSDGVVVRGVDLETFTTAVAELGAGAAPMAEAPLSVAAARVLGAAGTPSGAAPPPPCGSGMDLDLLDGVDVMTSVLAAALGSSVPGTSAPDWPSPEPAVLPAPREVARELAALPWTSSWFFDAPLLGEAGVELPRGRATAAWFASAARSLASTRVKPRLVAVARHQAGWHALRGERRLASLFAALAAATEQDFVGSPLARYFLERTAAEAPTLRTAAVGSGPLDVFGSVDEREQIRLAMDDQVPHPPLARHLAALDLALVAAASLRRSLLWVSTDRWPSPREMVPLSRDLGVAYADLVLAGAADAASAPLRAILTRAIQVGAPALDRLAARLVSDLSAFLQQVCGGCDLRCFEAPDAEMVRRWTSPYHPAVTVDDPEAFEGRADDDPPPPQRLRRRRARRPGPAAN